MESLKGGNMFEFLIQRKKELNPLEVKTLLRNILHAMVEL